MTSLRIAIVGNGRMGRAVAAFAIERGHTVQTIVTGAENAGGAALTAERLAGADVAIEFTRPDAAVQNIERLIALGIPAVTGTTGWNEALPAVRAMVTHRGGTLLHAANFSVGVQLFLRAAGELAALLAGRARLDAFILEEHHAAKRDVPSGTARSLADRVKAVDTGRAFPITSIRAGAIPGTHALTYDGSHETITLSHVARDRIGFAEGALAAAEWLPGRPGVHTFDDMLFGDDR